MELLIKETCSIVIRYVSLGLFGFHRKFHVLDVDSLNIQHVRASLIDDAWVNLILVLSDFALLPTAVNVGHSSVF